MSQLEYLGKCKHCGASCYYNEDLERFWSQRPAPGCLCEIEREDNVPNDAKSRS